MFKNISENLVKVYNDQVTVCTTNSLYDPTYRLFQALPKFECRNGVEIHRFHFVRFRRNFLLLIKKAMSRLGFHMVGLDHHLGVPKSATMKKFIDEHKVDVVCASSIFYAYIDYSIYRWNLVNPKPFVLMGAIHFDDESNITIPEHYLARIAQSDKYIANTGFEKECLVRLGVSSEKVDVIGCGVNISDFNKISKEKARALFGLQESDFVVGYVGRFAPSKDLITLVKAFETASTDDWKLVLAGGTNSHLDEIRQFVSVSCSTIKDRILFFVDFDESIKPAIYSSLDVFVSASYSESFGIVFLEAWASKLPVIGTDIGAIRSVITDGQEGRLFPVADHRKLANLLSFYFHDHHARIIHAQAGLVKIRENYTWEIITRKYRECYQEAIRIFNHRLAAAS